MDTAMGTPTKALVDERPLSSTPTLPWSSMAWFGALLILCYAPVLRLLVSQWMEQRFEIAVRIRPQGVRCERADPTRGGGFCDTHARVKQGSSS